MSEHQDELDNQGWRTSFTQTTEEMARAVVAAAVAVRPRPSIVFSANNSGSSRTLEKLQRQLTKVWKQGMSREGNRKAFFNPEHLTSQKRQWTQLQMQMLERKKWKDPDCLFEHMVVVGLHPDTQTNAIEAALLRRRTWEREVDVPERFRDVMRPPLRSFSLSMPEPQVLFSYPPGKRLPMRPKDLLAFCFPGGVEMQLVERTPSLSELNEIIFGQDHLLRDDLSYTFLLKVADNATLYGVCMYVPQLVKQPPGLMTVVSSSSPKQLPLSRFSVTAYRCYCFLTKLPFFDLHFDVLNSIITQERFDRITECVNEMTVSCLENGGEKIIANDDAPLSSCPQSPKELVNSDLQSFTTFPGVGCSPTSNGNLAEALEEAAEGAGYAKVKPPLRPADRSNDHTQVDSLKLDGEGSHSNGLGKGGLILPDNRNGESRGISDSIHDDETSDNHEDLLPRDVKDENIEELAFSKAETRVLMRVESTDSMNSMAESFRQYTCSEDDEGVEEASPSGQCYYYGSKLGVGWAEVDNGLLRILHQYYKLPIPARGSSLVFQPLEHLRPLQFARPADEAPTLLGGRALNLRMCRTSLEVVEMQAAINAAEESLAMSTWTVATVCRVLSLENVLAIFAGVLLEKQIVVVCPNLGVLSAVVLSAIPLIRPFQWQSLMLPILPNQMLDFLDAPVPYIVGVQQKSSVLRGKSSIILVNVQRNKVSMSSTPQLPHLRELVLALQPYHSRLAAEEEFARKHPVHVCNDAQSYAAGSFLAVLRSYLESLCGNLRSHTITNVQSNNDKVSLLLKESFVEDFDNRDHPFMKLFVDTQLFSVHTDAVLSFIESN